MALIPAFIVAFLIALGVSYLTDKHGTDKVHDATADALGTLLLFLGILVGILNAT